MERILNDKNVGIKFNVINKGMPGTNVSDVVAQAQGYIDQYQPKIVIAMLGINDEKSYVLYKDTSLSKGKLFLQSLRVYKLGKLLWAHLTDKCKTHRHNFKDRRPGPRGAMRPSFKNDKACVEAGLFYRNSGDFNQAIEMLNQALRLNPNDLSAYNQLAQVYLANNNFNLAEEMYKKIIQLKPDGYKAYYALGELYVRQNRYLQAQKALDKAIELAPAFSDSYEGLSVVYTKLGKDTLAGEYLMQIKVSFL